MKKLHPLLSVLFLISIGFGQQLSEVIETYENGNIKSITYHKKTRDGIKKVKEEGYLDNGKKEFEGTFKDGEQQGLHTYWYENGKKKSEETWKGWKRISSKEWNEDGSVME